jgi:hypothetical protein
LKEAYTTNNDEFDVEELLAKYPFFGIGIEKIKKRQ